MMGSIRIFHPFSNRIGNLSGQVIVEYVLLLIVAVALALLITRQLVSRDPDDAGIVTKKWSDIEDTIGKDLPDEPQK